MHTHTRFLPPCLPFSSKILKGLSQEKNKKKSVTTLAILDTLCIDCMLSRCCTTFTLTPTRCPSAGSRQFCQHPFTFFLFRSHRTTNYQLTKNRLYFFSPRTLQHSWGTTVGLYIFTWEKETAVIVLPSQLFLSQLYMLTKRVAATKSPSKLPISFCPCYQSIYSSFPLF